MGWVWKKAEERLEGDERGFYFSTCRGNLPKRRKESCRPLYSRGLRGLVAAVQTTSDVKVACVFQVDGKIDWGQSRNCGLTQPHPHLVPFSCQLSKMPPLALSWK